jgi:HEAT repeat protein
MSAASLSEVRKELRATLEKYSHKVVEVKTEEEAFRDEAEFAGSGLKSEDIAARIRAVEFLEILGDNPFAQDYLLRALEDKEGSVVQKAIQALGKVADNRSVPRLQELSKTTNSKHIAAEVTRIIGKIQRNAENQ